MAAIANGLSACPARALSCRCRTSTTTSSRPSLPEELLANEYRSPTQLEHCAQGDDCRGELTLRHRPSAPPTATSPSPERRAPDSGRFFRKRGLASMSPGLPDTFRSRIRNTPFAVVVEGNGSEVLGGGKSAGAPRRRLLQPRTTRRKRNSGELEGFAKAEVETVPAGSVWLPRARRKAWSRPRRRCPVQARQDR